MDHRELEDLRRTLTGRSPDPAAWYQLGRWVARHGRLPDWLRRRRPLRALRALWRRAPGDRSLEALVLAVLGLEALPAGTRPLAAWWRGRRAPGRAGGVRYDATEGMPLLVRHVASGVELVWVPPGRSQVGHHIGGLHEIAPRPFGAPRRVHVPGGYMGRFPLTVAVVDAWLRASPDAEAPRDWEAQRAGGPDRPATVLTQEAAARLAAWCGGRLPLEVEWERAGRAEDGREYPWGNQPSGQGRYPTAAAAAGDEGPPEPVGGHPRGASPFGVEELSGHIAEWCQDEGVIHGGRQPGTARPTPVPLWRRRDLFAPVGVRVWIPT